MQEPQTPPSPPSPSPAPAAPVPAVQSGANAGAVSLGGGVSIAGAKPSEVYQALRAQRRVLNDQLESLEEQRRELAANIERPAGEGGADVAGKPGLEQRLAAVDQRITEVGQQIAASEREIARVAGIPGAAVDPPQPPDDDTGETVAVIGVAFIFFVLFPLTMARARRLWRRASHAVAPISAEVGERFTRLEQAVESVAIEVERISEGQRFVTNLLAEGRGSLGAGAAKPVEVNAQQREPAYRTPRG